MQRGGPSQKGGGGGRGRDQQYGQRQGERQQPRGGGGEPSRGGPSQPPPSRLLQSPSKPSQQHAAIPREEINEKCPPPMPPATQVQQHQGVSSIYTLNVKPGRKAYRYDVDICRLPMRKRNGEMDKGKSLVKAADDGQRALNRNLCFELMTIAFEKTERFGMSPEHELVYDCKSIMFTSTPLRKFDEPGGIIIDIMSADINPYIRTYCGESSDIQFNVQLQRNQAVPELDLNDFGQYQSGNSVFHEDRSLRTFFELAVAQFAINNEIFVPIGVGKLFEYPERQPNRVGNGMVLRKGLAKGVKVIRNNVSGGSGGGRNGNGPKAALVLDTKVSAFFEPQSLVKTVINMLPDGRQLRYENFTQSDWNRAETLLEDLRVEVDYRRTRTFELGKFTEKPIKELYLDDVDLPNGGGKGRMSVPEYFKMQYNINLKYTDLPGIKPNTPVPPGRKAEIFPLEVLNVMEDQRVPLQKTSPELMAKLLDENSLPPHLRMEQIIRRARDLGLFHEQNPVLCAFGISIDQKSNQVTVGVRALPKIRFRNREIAPEKVKGDWRREGSRLPYLESDKLNKWMVLADRRIMDTVRRFVNMLIETARFKGIQIETPEILPFNCSESNDRDWDEKFEKCANEEIPFVMLIDNKQRDTHGLLKLYEVMYKPLCTQHVTFEKVRDVVTKNQRQTLENIMNKLNMKNYGLNYQPIVENCGKRFALENGNVLVIGYDVSHPQPMRNQDKRRLQAQGESELSSLEPSVVGICANMAPNPHAFVGDYFFQESRKEALDMDQLADRMEWILLNLEQNRPNQSRPKFIFILRDGLSEGQFAMACKEELEAIRVGCARRDPNYKPEFFLLVGTKRHFKKFFIDGGFNNGRPHVENLPPGSVIQEKIVRADLSEFYFHPHCPIKGTGKALEVAILANEPDASMDEIQALMMSLSYSHQIVNLPISEPEPIYQADELAKRGKNNFAAFKKFYYNQVPMREIVLTATRDGARRQQTINCVDYRRVTEMLAYWGNGTETLSHRFTA